MSEQRGNIVERRSNLLAEAIRDRVNSTYKSLTEPQPAFQVAVSQEDQIKVYQERLASGELIRLRRSAGGPHDDAEVDRYVDHMERALGRRAMQPEEPEL